MGLAGGKGECACIFSHNTLRLSLSLPAGGAQSLVRAVQDWQAWALLTLEVQESENGAQAENQPSCTSHPTLRFYHITPFIYRHLHFFLRGAAVALLS